MSETSTAIIPEGVGGPYAHISEALRPLAVPIESLNLDPANARQHDERNIGAIRASLARWGQRSPVVVQREGMVVRAGNGRVIAARGLGWRHIAALVVDESSVEATAFAIADNRTAELAEWDNGALAGLLEAMEPDMRELAGFDQSDLDTLLRELGGSEIVEDEVPEPPAEPITKVGDLWLLGEHRLLCGDSTKAEDVARVLGGAKADMMFTDPPWNVAIGKDSNPRHRQREGLANDDLSPEQFTEFLSGFARRARDVVAGDVYVVLGASEWPTLDLSLRSAGFHWSATIIWVKDVFVLGRSKYHRRYEPIWYGWAKDGKSSFCKRRDLDDVWQIARPKRSQEHPTMKPVELVARAIANSSVQSVYDPFVGSGTTIIAAEQLNRRCYAIEISPAYVDVCVQRWEKLTGRKAVRQ